MKSHRIVAVAGTVLFGALLLGATDAAAAPPGPRGPEIAAPATEADPCVEACRPADCPENQLCPAPEEPCETDCAPAEEPERPEPEQPAEPAEPDQPAEVERPAGPAPAAKPVAQPRLAPVGVPTPTRIDTGEGPGDPVNWWLVGVPALVLLGIAAGGARLWIARTERSPR